MATFDPFEKEFRRQAHGLRRTPATATWSRLEHRLDRRRGTRILGIRPWMIAALFLLAASASVITRLSHQQDSPLAQRAQIIEELSAPYTPNEPFVPVEYEHGVPALGEPIEQREGFRGLVVAEKYRG